MGPRYYDSLGFGRADARGRKRSGRPGLGGERGSIREALGGLYEGSKTVSSVIGAYGEARACALYAGM